MKKIDNEELKKEIVEQDKTQKNIESLPSEEINELQSMFELTSIESSNHLKEVSKKNKEIKILKEKEKVKENEIKLNNQMCMHQSIKHKIKRLRSEASTLKKKCEVEKKKHRKMIDQGNNQRQIQNNHGK